MSRAPEHPADFERKVLECWHDSATHWQQLIDQDSVASRIITSPAIEQAVLSYQPSRVLDVGCGEGWLARKLANRGIQVTGVDAVESLVNAARAQDPHSHYLCLEYDALPGPLADCQFDLAVCNFSLFGDQSVQRLVTTLLDLLPAHGHLLIQTLHPLSACQGDYREGWRNSQWQGLNEHGQQLGEAPPWFFRSLAGWLTLLQQSGRLVHMQEPLDPETRLPLSALFHVQPVRQQDRNKP